MTESAAQRLTPPVGPNDHALGSADALVTLVAYSDFCCPFCRVARPVILAAQRQLGADLRFVYRPFPLVERYPHAQRAAEAAELAGMLAGEAAFWAMHTQLFTTYLRFHDATLSSLASAIGLDVVAFRSGLASGQASARVRDGMRSGVESGVYATPTFFVNDRLHDPSWTHQARFIASLRDIAHGLRLARRQ